jgi:hypothetical protein
MTAAAELMAELGWGRVVTRAVATRGPAALQAVTRPAGVERHGADHRGARQGSRQRTDERRAEPLNVAIRAPLTTKDGVQES